VLRVTERVRDDCVVTPNAGAGALSGKRLRLGAELRRARELGGLSGRQLAQRIGISQSKVSRAESGSALLSIPEVAAWASATGVSPDVASLLSALTEAAYTEVHNWGNTFRDRPHIQGDIQDLEKRACKVLTFQPSVVPGLLQTAEYARQVFTMFQPPYPEAEVPEVLAARLDRQFALFAGSQRFEFLITEAALRWRPGPPALLQAQLDRIASLSTLDTVSIGLIPLSVEAVTNTSHGFVLFEMAEHDESDAVVLVETIHANLVVNDPESIALYRARWSLLEQMAISGDEALAFLAALASDVKKAATLIWRRRTGNAAYEGALHSREAPDVSVEVELAELHGPDEFAPFGHVEDEHRPVGVLGVAHRHDRRLADFHARAAALAGAGEADHYVHRASGHQISSPDYRRGISVPFMEKAWRGLLERDLERDLGREMLFSCATDRVCDRTRTQGRDIARSPERC
jgi:transcriptional regulator with XRE-family HTH domain